LATALSEIARGAALRPALRHASGEAVDLREEFGDGAYGDGLHDDLSNIARHGHVNFAAGRRLSGDQRLERFVQIQGG
jgi:hypothetical protein